MISGNHDHLNACFFTSRNRFFGFFSRRINHGLHADKDEIFFCCLIGELLKSIVLRLIFCKRSVRKTQDTQGLCCKLFVLIDNLLFVERCKCLHLSIEHNLGTAFKNDIHCSFGVGNTLVVNGVDCRHAFSFRGKQKLLQSGIF